MSLLQNPLKEVVDTMKSIKYTRRRKNEEKILNNLNVLQSLIDETSSTNTFKSYPRVLHQHIQSSISEYPVQKLDFCYLNPETEEK